MCDVRAPDQGVVAEMVVQGRHVFSALGAGYIVFEEGPTVDGAPYICLSILCGRFAEGSLLSTGIINLKTLSSESEKW